MKYIFVSYQLYKLGFRLVVFINDTKRRFLLAMIFNNFHRITKTSMHCKMKETPATSLNFILYNKFSSLKLFHPLSLSLSLSLFFMPTLTWWNILENLKTILLFYGKLLLFNLQSNGFKTLLAVHVEHAVL